jgi:DNA-binding NtrC family response regulator
MNAPPILIVEDDDLHFELYEEALEDYELTRVSTGTEALRQIISKPYRLIILDHILDDGEEGLDFLGRFKELVPHVPVIVVSGALEAHRFFDALQGPRRAHYCLTKPLDLHELVKTVGTALEECGEAEIVRQFQALERSRRVDVEDLLTRSTDRLMRQKEIQTIVRGTKSRPNISALARQFKVARRTIIRDLQELIRRGELEEEAYPKWEPIDQPPS